MIEYDSTPHIERRDKWRKPQMTYLRIILHMAFVLKTFQGKIGYLRFRGLGFVCYLAFGICYFV